MFLATDIDSLLIYLDDDAAWLIRLIDINVILCTFVFSIILNINLHMHVKIQGQNQGFLEIVPYHQTKG